jgi:hypothetical protein
MFLAWYPNGANASSLYYQNGGLNSSPISNPSNQLVTVTYVIYPVALLVALWSVWARRPNPWQGLLIVPAIVFLAYQTQESGVTVGPALTLIAGAILLGAYAGERMSPSEPWRRGSHERPDYGRRGPRRFRLPTRVRAPFWTLFVIWVLMVGALYYGNFGSEELWYLPAILSVVAGGWLGFRYFTWVANIGDRAFLFLVALGSAVLFLFIDTVFIGPYYQATSPFNSLFGIYYSPADVGLAWALAAFGVPLALFVGLSVLYAGYKASRTVFVRYE